MPRNQERPQDFGYGVNAPLPPEAKKNLKIWLRNGAFVCWINNVVSIAPFSTPACLGLHLKILHKHRKLIFFACFRFLIFHPFFQKVSWPHLPLCAAAHAGNYVQHELFFIKPEIHKVLYCSVVRGGPRKIVSKTEHIGIYRRAT